MGSLQGTRANRKRQKATKKDTVQADPAPKFAFTGETRKVDGRILRRIYRLSDGLIGGWLESESNLSHDGECFVYDSACAYGNSLVRDNARLRDNARMSGLVMLQDHAEVSGRAWATGKTVIRDRAVVTDRAWVGDEAVICDEARIQDDAGVSDRSIVGQRAIIGGSTWIRGNSRVYCSTPLCKHDRVIDEIRF